MKPYSFQEFFHHNMTREKKIILLFIAILGAILAVTIGQMCALGILTWNILPLFVIGPILIVNPSLSLSYILLEAWLTKDFPLLGASFLLPLLTPALLASVWLIIYATVRAKWREESYHVPNDVLNVFIILFFGLIWISGYSAWGKLDITWVNNLVFYFLVLIFVNTPRRLDILVITGILGSVIMGLSGILQLIMDGSIPQNGISGSLANHVQYAWICWMGIPLAVVMWNRVRSLWQRRLLLGFIGLLSLAVVISFTRSVTVIFLGSSLFLLPKSARKIWVYLPIVLSIALVLLIPSIQSRLFSLQGLFSKSDAQINSTMSGRLTLYKAAIKMIQKNLVFGIGYQRFQYEWVNYASVGNIDPYSSFWKMNLPTHSTFLQIAAELGIVGFILYVALFVFTFWNLVRARNKLRQSFPWGADLAWALLIIMTGFFVMGIFDNGGWNERYFYLVLALAVVLRNWAG